MKKETRRFIGKSTFLSSCPTEMYPLQAICSPSVGVAVCCVSPQTVLRAPNMGRGGVRKKLIASVALTNCSMCSSAN